MVVKVAGLGRSFGGVAAYCLHDAREAGQAHPETDERVEWTDTHNLPTNRPDRAAAVMAATAEAAPDLKRLVGGSGAGRKLAKPVYHYSLNWAPDETPDRQEMSRAVEGSLKELELEGHQVLVVAHNDTDHQTRACDREPGRSGDRASGAAVGRQVPALEVGPGLRGGAGPGPVRAEGREQRGAGEAKAGVGHALRPHRETQAGEAESPSRAPP